MADINSPDITPIDQNPMSVARPDETPRTQPIVELEHNVQCRFSVTGQGVLKAKFQIGGRKPPDITPWFRTPGRRVLNQRVMSGGFTSANPEI